MVQMNEITAKIRKIVEEGFEAGRLSALTELDGAVSHFLSRDEPDVKGFISWAHDMK